MENFFNQSSFYSTTLGLALLSLDMKQTNDVVLELALLCARDCRKK